MRTLEWLIVASLLPTMVWCLQPQWPVGTGWLVVVTAVIVLLHFRFEGMHWQIAPAYMATGLLLLVVASGTTLPLVRISCGILAALLVAASLGFSWALPMFQLPRTTGKYPVGTRTLNIIDPVRKEMHSWAKPGAREIVVQLWYPSATGTGKKAMYRRAKETSFKSSYQAVLPTDSIQDAALAEGRFPIILHNPGWHGWRQRGTFLAQELASQGFIVAGISHPYNSSYVELADGTMAHPDFGLDLGFSLDHYIPLEERFALADGELAIQTDDCRLLLDCLETMDRTPGNPLQGHLRLDCVGAHGFSFGGAVSAEFARVEPRVRSVLELDGVLHGESFHHGLDKPLMLIDTPWMVDPQATQHAWIEAMVAPEVPWGAQVNKETLMMWKMIADAKVASLTRFGGYRLILAGMGHFEFTDVIFMSPLKKLSQVGSVPPKRAAEIINAYSVAFFQQTLLGEPSPLLSEHANIYPEATLQRWNAGAPPADQDGDSAAPAVDMAR